MSIEQKLQAYLNSAAGQAKIESAIEQDVLNEVNNLIGEVEQEQDLLPFDFGITAGSITFVSDGVSVRAECDIEFNHEDAKRAAFWSKGKWPEADLIYLYNNSWSFDSDNPPQGYWHGHTTTALTSGPSGYGAGFIRSAANRYLASAPVGTDVEIDGSYK